MYSLSHSVIALLCNVGAAHAYADDTLVTLEPTRSLISDVAHVYYNAASGERVVTLVGDAQTAPADTGSSTPVWSSTVRNACESFGYTTEPFFIVDDPTSGTPLTNQVTLMDNGDVSVDTVVDCIQVSWVTNHIDVDLNADEVGDGIEELSAVWTIWDRDNARAYNGGFCCRLPLVNILIQDLPGRVDELSSHAEFARYTMDIDLIAHDTGINLSFELGDSDGDCQSAAFCNSSLDVNSDGIPDGVPVSVADMNIDGIPDSDIDGDGPFDWAWSVRFFQPGYGHDFDSDSDTGQLPSSDADSIGVSLGFPAGQASDHGNGTWEWSIDTASASAGTGAEDRYALFGPPSDYGHTEYTGEYIAAYWFGGFACTGGLQSTGGSGYTPPGMFHFVLYSPKTSCESFADLNGDGQVNFFDVSLFIQDWLDGGDYNGDRQTDYFDVSLFIMDYNAGCP